MLKNKNSGGRKGYRVPLDLAEGALLRVDQLKDDLKCPSRAELFRTALRVLDWVVTTRARGAKFQVVEADGKVMDVELLI